MPRLPFIARLLILPLLLVSGLRADLPVSPQVLDPQTVPEAWNVIRLATANVGRLLKEKRVEEVPQQVALCSAPLRLLARSAPGMEQSQRIEKQTTLAFRLVNDMAQAGMARLQQSCETSFAQLQTALAELQPAFSASDVGAEIYACPEHAEMVASQAEVPCRFCGGRLRIRRIPYTDLSATPETPQTALSLAFAAKPAAGVPVTLTAQLPTPAGKPVSLANLMPLHGAPVRLLLVDQALSDFHVLTPAASEKTGQLSASFTPAVDGPYRCWAEVVPENTAIPEHPSASLGGEFQLIDRSKHAFVEALSATVEGLHFQLTFTGGNGGFPPARQVSVMRLQITDAASQPVTRLEPFMQAFAHLTAIYDDGQTMLRLHPMGGDILRDDVRGGPSLSFKIYPPRTGFLRLFCQLRVDGRVLTVPLGVQIPQ